MKDITCATFDQEVYGSTLPVVVDFWADWCGPCKAVAPALEQLARDYRGQVKFMKVNIDVEGQLAKKFQVRSIPTLCLVKDGKVVTTVIGPNVVALRKALQEHA